MAVLLVYHLDKNYRLYRQHVCIVSRISHEIGCRYLRLGKLSEVVNELSLLLMFPSAIRKTICPANTVVLVLCIWVKYV